MLTRRVLPCEDKDRTEKASLENADEDKTLQCAAQQALSGDVPATTAKGAQTQDAEWADSDIDPV